MADPKRSAAPKTTGKGGKKKANPWVRALIWVVSILLSLGVIGVGAIAVAYSMIKLPDPNSDFQTNTSFVYYRGRQDEDRLVPGAEPAVDRLRQDPRRREGRRRRRGEPHLLDRPGHLGDRACSARPSASSASLPRT